MYASVKSLEEPYVTCRVYVLVPLVCLTDRPTDRLCALLSEDRLSLSSNGSWRRHKKGLLVGMDGPYGCPDDEWVCLMASSVEVVIVPGMVNLCRLGLAFNYISCRGEDGKSLLQPRANFQRAIVHSKTQRVMERYLYIVHHFNLWGHVLYEACKTHMCRLLCIYVLATAALLDCLLEGDDDCRRGTGPFSLHSLIVNKLGGSSARPHGLRSLQRKGIIGVCFKD